MAHALSMTFRFCWCHTCKSRSSKGSGNRKEAKVWGKKSTNICLDYLVPLSRAVLHPEGHGLQRDERPCGASSSPCEALLTCSQFFLHVPPTCISLFFLPSIFGQDQRVLRSQGGHGQWRKRTESSVSEGWTVAERHVWPLKHARGAEVPFFLRVKE